MDQRDDFVSLRDYIDVRIANLDAAIKVAADAMDRRLEGMNEFRDQLRDQASRFVTRLEVEAAQNRLVGDIRLLHDERSNFVRREDIERLIRDVRELRESKAMLEGKASQQSVNLTLMIAILSTVLGVANFITRLL